MRRPYIPHPGPLPSAEEAQRRWVRPTGGEVPYEAYVDLAREGIAPFDYSVVPETGESHAQLVDRVMRSGDLNVQAAHAVAIGLQGFEHRREGRKAVHAAELLAHHETARFRTDPTPVRGDLDACVSPVAFESVSPSIAVNLSALRSLRWDGKLRPQDILLLWILIGCASAGRTPPRVSALKEGFGISRPHEGLRRLRNATFSFKDEPDIVPEKWLSDCTVSSERLLEIVKPTAGGENYAYLELRTLAALTAQWQEKALRGVMAAAVRARAYWSGGGIVRWRLSRGEVMELFCLPESSDWRRLRKERLQPFSRILESTMALKLDEPYSFGSRFRVSYGTVRNEGEQGRPAAGIELTIRVIGAPEAEVPTRGFARERTEDRASRQQSEVELFGLGKALTHEERKQRRSLAAKKGWKKRRTASTRPAELSPPRRPNKDEMEVARTLGFLTETPQEALTRTSLARGPNTMPARNEHTLESPSTEPDEG